MKLNNKLETDIYMHIYKLICGLDIKMHIHPHAPIHKHTRTCLNVYMNMHIQIYNIKSKSNTFVQKCLVTQ